MAKTELRRGPSRPRAARSASRQPVSSSPSGMSIPTTVVPAGSRSGASSAARDGAVRDRDGGPGSPPQRHRHPAAPARVHPRHAHPATAPDLSARALSGFAFSPVLSGEATTSPVTEPLGFPGGRGDSQPHSRNGRSLPTPARSWSGGPRRTRCPTWSAVLELAADGQVRYSAATRRPSAATVKLVEDVLVAGDFYDSGEPIAAFAWPLLIQVGGLARLAGHPARALPARPRDAGPAVLRGARRAVGTGGWAACRTTSWPGSRPSRASASPAR